MANTAHEEMMAAEQLAVEVRESGCRSVEEYQGVCDANESIVDAITSAGIAFTYDEAGYAIANRVTALTDQILAQ